MDAILAFISMFCAENWYLKLAIYVRKKHTKCDPMYLCMFTLNGIGYMTRWSFSDFTELHMNKTISTSSTWKFEENWTLLGISRSKIGQIYLIHVLTTLLSKWTLPLVMMKVSCIQKLNRMCWVLLDITQFHILELKM